MFKRLELFGLLVAVSNWLLATLSILSIPSALFALSITTTIGGRRLAFLSPTGLMMILILLGANAALSSASCIDAGSAACTLTQRLRAAVKITKRLQ